MPYAYQGDENHQEGDRDNDAHGEMRTDACAEEFMMDVVLVGEEGIPVVTNTCHDHPDNIQHRDEHRGQANDQHLTGEGTPCPTGHVDKEEVLTSCWRAKGVCERPVLSNWLGLLARSRVYEIEGVIKPSKHGYRPFFFPWMATTAVSSI